MAMRYEYKFVRLDETKPTMLGLDRAPVFDEPDVYQRSVHEHAALGWRLVQIFAPPTSYPSGGPRSTSRYSSVPPRTPINDKGKDARFRKTESGQVKLTSCKQIAT